MAGIADVTQVLINAQHVDTAVRQQAEEHLRQFAEQNFPGFMASLSTELATATKPADARRLAGLLMKNYLDVSYGAGRVLGVLLAVVFFY